MGQGTYYQSKHLPVRGTILVNMNTNGQIDVLKTTNDAQDDLCHNILTKKIHQLNLKQDFR